MHGPIQQRQGRDGSHSISFSFDVHAGTRRGAGFPMPSLHLNRQHRQRLGLGDATGAAQLVDLAQGMTHDFTAHNQPDSEENELDPTTSSSTATTSSMLACSRLRPQSRLVELQEGDDREEV